MTEPIDKLSSTHGVLKTKNVGSKTTVSLEKVEAKDEIVLSPEAKAAIENKRFVDMLVKMPSVRPEALEKEYDYASPKVFQEVAKRLLEDGF